MDDVIYAISQNADMAIFFYLVSRNGLLTI